MAKKSGDRKTEAAAETSLPKPEAEFVGDVAACFLRGKPDDGRGIFQVDIDPEKLAKFSAGPTYVFARTVYQSKSAVLAAMGVTVTRISTGTVTAGYRAKMLAEQADMDKLYEEPAVVDCTDPSELSGEDDAAS